MRSIEYTQEDLKRIICETFPSVSEATRMIGWSSFNIPTWLYKVAAEMFLTDNVWGLSDEDCARVRQAARDLENHGQFVYQCENELRMDK